MKPENSSPGGDVQQSAVSNQSNQHASANVIRSQIDALYGGESVATPTPQAAPQATTQVDINPYERTHNAHPQPKAEQWKQYHSAWQEYYQKYYEGYYAHKQRQATPTAAPQVQSQGYFTNHTDLLEAIKFNYQTTQSIRTKKKPKSVTETKFIPT